MTVSELSRAVGQVARGLCISGWRTLAGVEGEEGDNVEESDVS